MKTIKFLVLALSMSFATTAHAQQGNGQRNNNAGLLPLPPGIARIIAVDAQNTLLAESDGETNGFANGASRQFFGITVRHVYAGGIARLFGGEVIPTAPFVSPFFNQNNGGFNGNNGNNQNNNGGFNNGGFNNGNFGNNNFGNNNFGNNNFNGGNASNNANGRR